MNQKYISISIAIAVVLLGVICVKLIKIENQLNKLEMSTQSTKNELIDKVNASMNGVKESLLPKNQLITSYKVEYGQLDQKTMKIPVTVNVVPAKYEKETLVELKINDTRVTMRDTGTTFTEMINADLFKDLSIEVILTKGNTREVILLEEPERIWEKYTLGIYGNYDGGVQHIPASNSLIYAGNVKLDFTGNEVKARQVDIYSDLNGKKKLIATYPNLIGIQFVEKINYKTQIKYGEFHSIYADVQDSMGLHYICPLSEKVGVNEKNDFIYGSETGNGGISMTGVVTEIRDSNGNVLLMPQN